MPLSDRAYREYKRRKEFNDYVEDARSSRARNRQFSRVEDRTNTDMSGYKEQQNRNSKASREDAYATSRRHPDSPLDTAIKVTKKGAEFGKNFEIKTKSPWDKTRQDIRPGSNYTNYNKTGNNEGRGGKEGREWKDHKWLTRERNADGKWIYYYGDEKALKDAKRKANYEHNLNQASKKAKSRNTGQPSPDPLRDIQRGVSNAIDSAQRGVSDAIGSAQRGVSDAIGNAQRAISNGANFISGALANTPLADIFKR